MRQARDPAKGPAAGTSRIHAPELSEAGAGPGRKPDDSAGVHSQAIVFCDTAPGTGLASHGLTINDKRLPHLLITINAQLAGNERDAGCVRIATIRERLEQQRRGICQKSRIKALRRHAVAAG